MNKIAKSGDARKKAKHYGTHGQIYMAQVWLEYASHLMPLTEMQIFNLKQSLGHTNFQKLDFSKIAIEENCYVNHPMRRL